ncbi:hypothetical protein [Nitratiruptor tergarcus]|uniref:Type II secretory pathway, pseudopilin PulG n=1 Tax=Nitratiruptor tergarcus DSM 16512 TaxID=1069081 RepID=A0A1W1WVH9_9BACT|nr:hypothetical protein [Nitratiruptor tergarcus]SMC10182.1 Type II secretory pathway, pseudopilin PulG [Nitratiruptor tergarcus DSM 16512]
MKIVSKSSFTLFELLIVILIISILYGVFIQKLHTKEHLSKSLGLQDIKTLFEEYDFNESAKITCINKCQECYIFIDGIRRDKIEGFFDKEVSVYDFDIHGILSPVKFPPLFDANGNPQEVCFAYELFSNGSNSSYIVEYKDKFYIFYAYMKPVKVVDSISEAQKYFDPSEWIPTDSSQYNF